MSEPFVAEIRIFAGNFAPRGWAFCNGQLLPISQNTALFSLIGTTYGGDGRTTCALPNLEGRAPMHPGRGPGLTPRNLGESGGSDTVALTEAQMPPHTHEATAVVAPGNDATPAGNYPARGVGANAYSDATPDTSMASGSVSVAGGGVPHNNMQPYLAVNFIIALVGLYPSRS